MEINANGCFPGWWFVVSSGESIKHLQPGDSVAVTFSSLATLEVTLSNLFERSRELTIPKKVSSRIARKSKKKLYRNKNDIDLGDVGFKRNEKTVGFIQFLGFFKKTCRHALFLRISH